MISFYIKTIITSEIPRLLDYILGIQAKFTAKYKQTHGL